MSGLNLTFTYMDPHGQLLYHQLSPKTDYTYAHSGSYRSDRLQSPYRSPNLSREPLVGSCHESAAADPAGMSAGSSPRQQQQQQQQQSHWLLRSQCRRQGGRHCGHVDCQAKAATPTASLLAATPSASGQTTTEAGASVSSSLRRASRRLYESQISERRWSVNSVNSVNSNNSAGAAGLAAGDVEFDDRRAASTEPWRLDWWRRDAKATVRKQKQQQHQQQEQQEEVVEKGAAEARESKELRGFSIDAFALDGDPFVRAHLAPVSAASAPSSSSSTSTVAGFSRGRRCCWLLPLLLLLLLLLLPLLLLLLLSWSRAGAATQQSVAMRQDGAPVAKLGDAREQREELRAFVASEQEQLTSAVAKEREEMVKVVARERERLLAAFAEERDQLKLSVAKERDQLKLSVAKERDQLQASVAKERDQLQASVAKERENIKASVAKQCGDSHASVSNQYSQVQATVAKQRVELDSMAALVAKQRNELNLLSASVAKQRQQLESSAAAQRQVQEQLRAALSEQQGLRSQLLASVAKQQELKSQLQASVARQQELREQLGQSPTARLSAQSAAGCPCPQPPAADSMPDLAQHSAGAFVVGTRCTVTYSRQAAVVALFGIPVMSFSRSPTTALEPGLQLGECWAFEGFPGHLVVSLAKPAAISAVTIDHVPKARAFNGSLASAPRNFSVYGLRHERATFNEAVRLGAFAYDAESDQATQTFWLPAPTPERFPYAELVIESNHGSQYTCLYRFRVHGTL